jgi:hypothetical protein
MYQRVDGQGGEQVLAYNKTPSGIHFNNNSSIYTYAGGAGFALKITKLRVASVITPALWE